MFVIEKPGKHISGIFAQKPDAEAYLKLIPKTDKQKLKSLRDIAHYPFFIVERTKGDFEFFQYRKNVKDKKYIALYVISKDWRPAEPGQDYMGALDHEHPR